METNKATHTPYKTELFAPVMKECEGKYIAVLSDTSVDRDGERMGKSALEKVGTDIDYVAGLMDHKNTVANQVCEWINKKVVKIDGHTALIAEPRFFKSNPNAVMIKGMLDEGAKIGISIGAIVNDFKDETYEGKSMRTFTELELLEASFVAIPSNRHGRAMAVAKSYTNKGGNTMELTQKDIDTAVDAKESELKKEFDTQIKAKDSEISKLKKELEDSEKVVEDKTKEAETADEAKVEAEKKVTETEKALEAEKKLTLQKKNLADGANDSDNQNTPEDIDKAMKEGKLPVMRMQ